VLVETESEDNYFAAVDIVINFTIAPLRDAPTGGPTDEEMFDNPDGSYVFPDLVDQSEGTVLDFGCGCGRVARKLIQQTHQPQRYVGLDLHAGMIRWCQQNLAQELHNLHLSTTISLSWI